MRAIQVIILSFMLLLSGAVQSQSLPYAHPRDYPQFVMADDVEVQYVRGQLRFCERSQLRNRICGTYQKVFGKKIWVVQDWWTPETYVRAVSGLDEFSIWGVELIPQTNTIVIRVGP